MRARLWAKLAVSAVMMLGASLVLAGAAFAASGSEDVLLGGLLGDRAETVDILLLLTMLSVLPSILIMFTSFTRIIIIFSLLRSAMGTQQMPPNQVMVGLALFLTLFVMWGPITEIKENAYDPYVNGQITQEAAVEEAVQPLRGFMLRQMKKSDLQLFLSLAHIEEPLPLAEVPMHVLIPAFITSEIKTAFITGFLLYIPFIVIDMVVASTLMSMGMMMLPPSMISLPFKVMLFVLVDGWLMTIQSVVQSFH